MRRRTCPVATERRNDRAVQVSRLKRNAAAVRAPAEPVGRFGVELVLEHERFARSIALDDDDRCFPGECRARRTACESDPRPVRRPRRRSFQRARSMRQASRCTARSVNDEEVHVSAGLVEVVAADEDDLLAIWRPGGSRVRFAPRQPRAFRLPSASITTSSPNARGSKPPLPRLSMVRARTRCAARLETRRAGWRSFRPSPASAAGRCRRPHPSRTRRRL